MMERKRIEALSKDRSFLTHALLAGAAVVTLIAVVGIAGAQAQGKSNDVQTTTERYEKILEAEKAQQKAKGQYQNPNGKSEARDIYRDRDRDWDHDRDDDKKPKGKKDGHDSNYNKHGKATGIENANQHRPDHARKNYEAAKEGKENKGRQAEEEERGWFSRIFGWGKKD
jgi:hypothetical protein